MRITLEQAQFALKNGEVVAIPTETVYGLAASIHHPQAIKQIFILKNRPQNNPLIIHVSDVAQIREFALNLPQAFDALATNFWPGPLTLILPVDILKISEVIRAGLSTAAFRIPKHPLAYQLLTQTGPLVAPSANLSGSPSTTCPEHVEADFGSAFPVLDGGFSQNGVESTVLAFSGERWVVARLGAIPQVSFQPHLGYVPQLADISKGGAPISPGQLFRHYAPKAKLKLTPRPKGPFVLGFTDRNYSDLKALIPLGPSSDPEKVAFRLYEALRELDRRQIDEVQVDINFPLEGLWVTIAERLRKASQS